ncbi:MAG: glycosyltransferase [Syntrophobacterales bacterium]
MVFKRSHVPPKTQHSPGNPILSPGICFRGTRLCLWGFSLRVAEVRSSGNYRYFQSKRRRVHFLNGCREAQKFRKPYVVYPHGNFDPWALDLKRWRKKIWWQLFDKKNYRRAAAAVALTREEASQIRNMGFTGRIEVIPNGVDGAAYQEALSREAI